MDITTTVINQQFLGSLQLTHRITGLKSPKGTGKTLSISEVLQSLPSNKKKLVLGHRVALLAEAAERHGLDYYRDEDSGKVKAGNQLDNSTSGLALCVNSIPRLTLEHWKHIGILVIDEASQFVEHLFGDLCRDKRRELFEKLRFILNHSERIVLADADLNQSTVDFFCELMGKENEVSVVVNEFRPLGTPYMEVSDRSTLIGLAGVLLHQNKRVMFCCSSKAMSAVVYKTLGVQLPDKKGFLFNSDNSDKPEGIEFVRSINKSVTEYDYVVTSPSLGTGVSIDVEHFHSVFLLASVNCQIDEKQLHQLFHRVRHPQARFFCIEGQRVSGLELQPEYVRQKLEKEGVENKDLVMVLDEDGNYVPSNHDSVNKLFLKWESKRVLEKNYSVLNLRTRFIEYLKNENPDHIIHLNFPLEQVAGDLKALLRGALKGARFLVDMDAQRAIVHAPNITDQEAYELLLKGDEANAALTKWKIQRHYGTEEPTTEQLKDWLKGKAEERFENFLNVFWKLPKHLDLFDQEQAHDHRTFNSDQDFYSKKQELVFTVIRRAFGSVGRALKGKVFVTREYLDNNGFNEWFEEHKRELKFYLGLRAEDSLGALRAVLGWVGLGLKDHKQTARRSKEIPVMSASKIADTLRSSTKVEAVEVPYQGRYYSVEGFESQLQRACRLEPKHKTVKTKSTLLNLF
jgi:Origin of replication binding protein